MDIIDLMRPLGLLAVVFTFYVFIYHRTTKRKNGFYSNPDWNFFIKKWWALYKINNVKKEQLKNLQDQLSYKSERPLLLKNEHSSDSQMFFGNDQHGNSILIKLTRIRHRIADVWLVLRLGDGSVWTLPDHPDTRVSYATTGKFEAGGLKLECLQPYSRWRIIFNGILRKGIRQQWSPEFQEDELHHIKFNFFWATCSKPFFWPYDWSASLMADGIAAESWRDGNWIEALKMSENAGYDQFGELYGQVDLGQNDIRELHLPGIRQRRWGSVCLPNLRRSTTIIGVAKDGCIFTIGALSYREDLTHVQLGNLITPSGKVFPVDWTDLRMENHAEHPDVTPACLVIRFTAGGKMYKVLLITKLKKQVTFLRGRPFDWRTISTPFQFTINDEEGFGLINTYYPFKPSGNELSPALHPKLKKLVYNKIKPLKMKFTYSLDGFDAQNPAVTGGKGASLALLKSALNSWESKFTFSVPQGFVVSSAALKYQMVQNEEILKVLQNLEDVAYERSEGKLEDICLRVQNLIAESDLDIKIEESIRESLKFLEQKVSEDNGQRRYAVRSSGTDEDGETYSCAGQNETFLGLRDVEEILHATKKCWASLYSIRSISYRRQHIQSVISEMAVVIQIMIPSDTAGVLFTQHPVTGNPSQMTITANFGLGESVVSAQVDPDVFIVHRSYDSSIIEVEEIVVGQKMHAIEIDDAGTVKRSQLSEEIKTRPSLTDDHLITLSKIAVDLERMYGCPLDIEWAVYKDKIYLLQSRPITALNSFSDWELLHEFDSAIMTEEDCLTRANVGEVLPNPVTPLTQSYTVRFLEQSCAYDIYKENFQLYSKCLKMSHCRMFMDVINTMKVDVNKEHTFVDEVAGLSVLGQSFFNKEIHRIAKHRYGVMSYRRTFQIFYEIFKEAWNVSTYSKSLTEFISIFNSLYNDKKWKSFNKSLDTLAEIEKVIGAHFDFPNKVHLLMSRMNSIYQLITNLVLLEDVRELTSKHFYDMGLLMSVGTDVESADIPKNLDDIANIIYLERKGRDFIEVDPSEGVEWLNKNCIHAHRKLQLFLKRHGHRCLMEFDFASEPWEFHPEQVIGMIQANIKSLDTFKPGVGRSHLEMPEDVIDSLKTPKKKITRRILQFLLPFCTTSIQQREKSKSCLISFIHNIRKAFIILADQMYKEGFLPDRNLIFYLTREEISRVINHRDAVLINKALRRKKNFPEWDKQSFDDVIMGIPKFNNFKDKLALDELSNGCVKITGTPIGGGFRVGRACVLTDFAEVSKIQPGDILITQSTDIGWSPYFPILGGVVTELGGIMSHGAVVAREYGIPCLIAASGATNYFKFGEIVYLNADKGFITTTISKDE